MAQGKNAVTIASGLVTLAPVLVSFFRLVGKRATGAEKKAAAVAAGKSLAIAAGEIAMANNPKFAETYGGIIQAAYDAGGSLANVGTAEDVEPFVDRHAEMSLPGSQ